MNWQEEYKKRCCTAEEALSCVKSGDRVVIAHACGESPLLSEALVARADSLRDVEVLHMVAMGKAEYCKPELAESFRHHSLFIGRNTREAVFAGRGDFTPVNFSEIPRLFAERLPVDVILMQVSPPDEHGYCSYGISVDYTKPVAELAKCVIAHVNANMPRTLGDSFIHVSKIDHIVAVDAPVIELAPIPIGEVERKIGENCASLVRDGDTLQLGIGGIPDAVLMALRDKKDLGIHSEMFSDGVVDLVEAGVINNSKKTIHRGKSVVTFLMGTRKTYDYAHNNPEVELYPVDYVNDPMVIAKHDNMVSINSCVQVDLMGQVVSTNIGPMQISGVGGQLDFVRGANMSRGGRSVMAMPSTTGKGTISKIVPWIDDGSAVTTSRYDVRYVATEYGIADLWGRTLRERARELIRIAHPDFRESLCEAYEKKFHTTCEI